MNSESLAVLLGGKMALDIHGVVQDPKYLDSAGDFPKKQKMPRLLHASDVSRNAVPTENEAIGLKAGTRTYRIHAEPIRILGDVPHRLEKQRSIAKTG